MSFSKINVKALKSQLSIDDHKKIMKALDIPMFSENESQIVYFSGEKNANALNGSPKLIFYKDTGIYIGFTSGFSMDIIALVQRRLNLLKQPASFIDSINFILQTTGKEINTVKRINKPDIYNWEEDLGKFFRFRKNGTDLPVYDQSILKCFQNSLPQQWIDEGISEETLIKYQIGYYERLNQTTIPCFSKNGELYGIRVRNWNPERLEQAKYMPLITLDGTQYSFNTNNVLYGLNYNWYEIERTGKVWICEGEKSVLKLDSFYGEKSCAVAMYGSSLGLKRRNQLVKLGVKEVVIVADCDFINNPKISFEDWKNKIQKQIDLWKGYADISVVWDDGSILDSKENATDHDFDTWLKLYNEREFVE